ncbi:MAG: tRNA (adenosine(37)-N6)-threonylcarbamoyltransferase complex dimerization subunit type 1 TsaB [Rhodospirillales bacterium]|nr:tRNA (adenosine(37)-N6)-threonylcarbamoyltransferase complex dimerization subunit type 1 TsaB [Rhodospirillales bacterium]
MRILAFDTATGACSVAVRIDGSLAARRFEQMRRGQSEALIPLVDEVMKAAGIGFPDLDLLAVTVGPGAFTGVRIGLSAARAMALAAKRPCMGVTTLEAVAAGVPAEERESGGLLVALDAKRADVYAQVFGADLMARGGPLAVLPSEIPAHLPGGRILVAGDAAEPVIGTLTEQGIEAIKSAAPVFPDAALVAAIAEDRWSGNRGEADPSPGPPQPLYLRPPDVTLSPNSGRLRP